ncbi:MAG: glycogen/starch/alpha-glucan phosphorylase [Elusimicrobiota bacterium]|jgi:starch phosphorylase
MRVIEVAMEIAYPPELLEAVWARYGFRPAREVAMSSSVGGIGPLLRERIVCQAEKGVEVIGVSLLYETTWIQCWFEWGQLHLEKREVLPYLKEFLKETGIELTLPMYDGTEAKIKVWQIPYGKTSVYFLEAPPLTHVVYPSEEDAPSKQAHPGAWAEELRLKQSWLVGRGALALAKTLNFQPELIVQSETPTLFANHRLAQDAFQQDPFFENTRYIFNDHTPMEYAHPIWSRKAITRLKLDASAYVPPPALVGLPAGHTSASDKGDIDITRLLVGSVEGAFGVSQKHGRVMREMPSLKGYNDKIESITNGVYTPYWQAPEYQTAAALSDDALIQLKEKKKTELLDWVWRHYGLWHTWKEQVQGKTVVLWTRRITGYKRMDLLWTICKDANFKRQFLETDIVLFIGGRIHQHDDQAQTTVYNLLDLIALDKMLQERIVFLDNFNVWMAPHLFQGADAAIMLADDGREASATGFMKAQINGEIIIATEDGAIPESVTFMGREKQGQVPNGIEVRYWHGHPTTDELLRALKTLKHALKDPAHHAAMFRSALAAQSMVSVERTVTDTLALYQRVMERPLAISTAQPQPSL